jgi:hypothetical protein
MLLPSPGAQQLAAYSTLGALTTTYVTCLALLLCIFLLAPYIELLGKSGACRQHWRA